MLLPLTLNPHQFHHYPLPSPYVPELRSLALLFREFFCFVLVCVLLFCCFVFLYYWWWWVFFSLSVSFLCKWNIDHANIFFFFLQMLPGLLCRLFFFFNCYFLLVVEGIFGEVFEFVFRERVGLVNLLWLSSMYSHSTWVHSFLTEFHQLMLQHWLLYQAPRKYHLSQLFGC